MPSVLVPFLVLPITKGLSGGRHRAREVFISVRFSGRGVIVLIGIDVRAFFLLVLPAKQCATKGEKKCID